MAIPLEAMTWPNDPDENEPVDRKKEPRRGRVVYNGRRLLITWEGWKWLFKPLHCSRLGAKAVMLFGFQIAWRDQ